ncbi:MFS transporter [Paractinoplanes durhamensis]|uniref:MFS transporter n=2 Tax=Paractinoplanes durhamensis TaxID=113563 RepID=A0ABQ3ZBS1_9ACTN|nr:MFS transporter [Actinoplanes durhamensis]GIE07279.1 MFS transporter [Actinoplanes durhamensis]
MRRSLIFVLAVACGLTVANLYYSQPLLDLIADAFDVSQGAATVVVTVTQIGYAVGLLFLLPLGDLIENRKLTTRLLIGTAAALLLAAVSPAYTVFLLVSVLIGVTSVVAQILVPFAAHLAPEEQRGALVGKVMGGLLLGILLARTVSSFVADLFGWRAIYFVSAALMVGLAVVLRRMLPSRQPEHAAGYGSLLRTVWGLVRTEPVLRRRALCQGLVFGAFSAFWTAIAYELIGEHGLGQAQIAIFALVGAGGATAAPLAGKLADRGYGGIGSGGALLLAGLMAVLAAVGHSSVVVLAVAGFLLDFAVQAHQVMSQHEIYALRADARARINTVFMTTVFSLGALSSAITGLLHHRFGWTGACVLAAGFALVGFAVWGVGRWTSSRMPQAAVS